MSAPTRPILRYFGGKWAIREWVVGNLPPHKNYGEPFCGAASILMSKNRAPGLEAINDLNGDVINLFRVMRSKEESEELIDKLDWTPYAKGELKIAQEPCSDSVERARRLIVRSFMGIEGGGTRGRKSGFRTCRPSCGKVRNSAIHWQNWKDGIYSFRDRLKSVEIHQRDALGFIETLESSETLLYIDPPYVVEERGGTRYSLDGIDHGQLVEKMLKSGSKIVLSGYKCEEYRALEEEKWTRIDLKTHANGAHPRVESLWKSPNCEREGDLFS